MDVKSTIAANAVVKESANTTDARKDVPSAVVAAFVSTNATRTIVPSAAASPSASMGIEDGIASLAAGQWSVRTAF